MADVQGIRALKLHELLGAPLVAMIQADAQAARATLEFIETVGFATGEEEADASRLRMARFRYKKIDENGTVAEFEVEVPVLSLVPIPSLQVKEATVKLSAKIVDISTEKPPPATGGTVTAKPAFDVIKARALQISAKPVASSGAKTQEVRSSFDLDVEIKFGLADITLGMEKIIHLMDQAIRDEKPQPPQ